MNILRHVAATLLVVATTAVAAPVRYDLDPSHTHVFISWAHMGFSHPAARFDEVDGDFNFDANDPTQSSVTVTIPISSLDTGVAKLDEHLESPQFFDVEKFPKAVFKSTHVERAGKKGLKVTGDLSIHGVTRPVVLDVTINRIGEHPMGGAAAGFDARTVIKRSDFGLGYGVPNVSDEIAIDISTETHIAKPAATAAQ